MPAVKILVGSKNPVKINSVKQAFSKAFSTVMFEVEGVNSESGVPDQPVGDSETFHGAVNRAEYIFKKHPNADYWVGIEGGIEIDEEDDMEAYAWVYIKSLKLKGKAKTANFYIPKEVSKLVREGHELGHADDMVFGKSNSKQSSGSVGILTNGLLNRTEYYEQAVLLALIPFLNPKLNF
ncbi:MAG: inosine/xanthosine triphosphatase [Cytophagales bacterium]